MMWNFSSGKQKITLLLIISVLALAASCGGNSTPTSNNNNNNNGETSDYFPVGIGSWWKFKTSYDITDTSQYSIDSTVLTGQTLVNGKNAYEFIRNVKDRFVDTLILQETSYYYMEGPVIYKFMNNGSTGQNEWMLFADMSKDYISIINTTLNNFKISSNQFFTGSYKIERFTDGPDKYYLPNDTINCIKTRFVITWDGKMTTDGDTQDYQAITLENQWFGYKVGLVRLFWDDGTFDQSLMRYYLAPATQ